jgi:hypothetical protein
VHGRTAAGGQSQQRFARYRESQARAALRAVADTAAWVLLAPYNETGRRCPRGDTTAALRSLAADPRLVVLLQRAEPWVLDIAELRRAVFGDAARWTRCAVVQVWPRETAPD